MGKPLALVFNILANDQASKKFNAVGSAAEKTGHQGSTLGAGMAAGVAAGTVAVTAFAKSAVDKFVEVGKETKTVIRYIGGTAESASRLRFAAEESGVSVESLSMGLGKFSKALVGSGEKTKTITSHVQVATGAWHKQTTTLKDAAGHFQTVTKMVPVMAMQSLTRVVSVTNPMVAKLGFAIKDAHGKLLPMSELLPKVADKFKTMPNGTEKTALALQLFGKNGMSLLPFLNKGASGIEELEKQSDKLGNTMSGKDLDAITANIVAKREWKAAITGVQIQLGRALLPVMTTFTRGLQAATRFASDHGRVVKPLAAALAGLAIATLLVNKTMAAGRAMQTAYLAVKALLITSTNAETGATNLSALAQVRAKVASIAGAVATGAMTVAQWALNVALNANPIGLVIIGLVALAAGFVYAYKHVTVFRQVVQIAFGWIKDHWPLLLAILTGPIGLAVLLISRHWTAIKSAVSSVLGWIKSHWPLLLAILTGPFGLAVLYISRHWDTILATVKALPGRITSALGNVGQLLLSAGGDLISGLIHGITGSAGRLITAIRQTVTDKLPDFVRKALGISSPSTVFALIGTWTAQGFINGLTSKNDAVRKAAHTLADHLKQGMNAGLTAVQGALDKTKAKIATLVEFRKGVADSARQSASMGSMQFEGPVTVAGIKAQMGAKLAAIKAFAANLAVLRKQGFDPGLIAQVVAAGVDQGGQLAAVLAAGGDAKGLNALQAGINTASTALGSTAGLAVNGAREAEARALAKKEESAVKSIRYEIHVHGPADTIGAAREIEKILTKLRRERGVALSFA